MVAVAFVAALLIGVNTPSYKEFASHSNGNDSFGLTFAMPCGSGLRDSGYAFAPLGFVIFKQRGFDGIAGETCSGTDLQ